MIIATLGGRSRSTRALPGIADSAPHEVIISAPDASHVDPYEGRRFTITHVFGPAGLTVQRNAARDMAWAERRSSASSTTISFPPTITLQVTAACGCRSFGCSCSCHTCEGTVGRHIVCIHDLHTRLMPESYGLLFRLAHRAILPLLGRRASRNYDGLWAVARELVHYGIAPRSKIVVTHNGSDHTKHWNPDCSKLPA